MQQWAVVAVVVAFFVIVVRNVRAAAAVEAAALAEAARTLGLTHRPALLGLRGGSLEGRMGPFEIRVYPVQRERDRGLRRRSTEARTVYEVHGLPARYGFTRQTLAADLLQMVTGPDLQTGDEGFDRSVVVQGDEKQLRAALDAPTRDAIHRVLHQPAVGSIRSGTIRIEIASTPRSGGEVTRQIQELVGLARRLAVPPSEIPARLAHNARSDNEPRIRVRALAALQQHFHGAATQEALRAALADPSWEVRAVAARALPAPETLVALAKERRAAPEVRADCLRAAATQPDRPLRRDELIDLLHDPASLVRQAALRLTPVADPALARAELPGWPAPEDPAERLALAEAVARVRSPAAEARLIDLVGDADRSVRLAAIRGLAETGTVQAVAALRAATSEAFGLTDVASAATAAITRIQGRLPRAEVGQLSLADAGPVGALGLASEAGTLGLAPETAAPPVPGEARGDAPHPTRPPPRQGP